ncbi:probable ubiquitin carboxyl-terminal hydrolase MINDY-4 [Brienomyrus brachyistius]|uniref:probable ubiquitin carboxyl-terminal hydrolase MINDY-4 n=1 Tax=Brienomyrus brachyistius TaxID=42636 RepID=UPI0020B1C8C9|nr:probable ubiquitin carboxyl-terminal hydrolase MINDY-4 [Brienomyrus brachyistius]
MTKVVEEVAASLVREYLSRKGLKRTLTCMDEEFPRTDSSINNRGDLRHTLHIEALYKKNKLQEFPLKSMLEIVVKECIRKSGDNSAVNCCSDEQLFLKKSNPSVMSHSKVKDASDDEKNKQRTGDNPNLWQHKGPLSQTSETCNTKQQNPSLGSSFTPESDQIYHPVPFSQESCNVSCKTAPSKNDITDVRKGRTSRIMRGMMAGPTASYAQECHKKKETRRFCGSSVAGAKDEGSRFDIMSLSAQSNSAGRRERPGQLPLGAERQTQESVQENVKPSILLGGHMDIRGSFERLKMDDKNGDRSDRPEVNRRQNKKKKSATNSKAPSLHLQADMTLDDFNCEEDLHNLSTGPVVSSGLCTKADLHSIDQKMAITLKELLFGSKMSCFNEEWKAQSFIFSDLPDLRYGIVQKKGGPCGVLASIQACVLQKLLFEDAKDDVGYQRLHPSSAARSKSLLLAIAEILWRAGKGKRATVAISSGRNQFIPTGKYKSEGVLEMITFINVNSFEDLSLFLDQHIQQFESGPYGCVLLTVSAILSRSVETVRADFDMLTNTLIGAHGYCTQELVNLLLCGEAVSNVFDDSFELDSGNGNTTVLKGIKEPCDIGFLSLFEHHNICRVGTYMKTPRFPIWVVCSESHFSVLFCTRKELLTNPTMERKFDLYYYDGLANQQEEIRLTIFTGSPKSGSEDADVDLIPPLEHCIRTKWKDAIVDWNETEPIL